MRERECEGLPSPWEDSSPVGGLQEIWGLGGSQDLSRGHHIQRESSDCDLGGHNLLRLCPWTASYSLAQNQLGWGGAASCDMTQGEGCHDSQSCDDLKILLRS